MATSNASLGLPLKKDHFRSIDLSRFLQGHHEFQGLATEVIIPLAKIYLHLSLHRHVCRSKFDAVNPQAGRHRKKGAARGYWSDCSLPLPLCTLTSQL